MKNQIFAGVAAAIAIASLTTPVQAAPIPDTTLINYYQNGSATGGQGDVLGPFDTSSVEVSFTGLTIQFKFLTAFTGSYIGANYADMFIASDPLNPDSFNYGLSLGFEGANGGHAAGLYQLSGSGDYKTSNQIWASSGDTYGGQYISPNDSLGHDAPTVVTGGTLVGGWTVTANQTPSGDGTFPYYLTVTMTADNTADYYDVFDQLGLSAFWGTGDCSNDAVYLTHLETPPHTQSTPEPATLLLFGSGLLGAGALRRRRMKG